MKRAAVLNRQETGDAGTFGTLVLDNGKEFVTGELPWRNNAPSISCIPPGVYTCTWDLSSRHGYCYHVQGVYHRAGIEIHSANFMGDESKGFKCELLGCIALGLSRGILEKQMAVLQSKAAIEQFNDDLNKETFQLTIHPVEMSEVPNAPTSATHISG